MKRTPVTLTPFQREIYDFIASYRDISLSLLWSQFRLYVDREQPNVQTGPVTRCVTSLIKKGVVTQEGWRINAVPLDRPRKVQRYIS